MFIYACCHLYGRCQRSVHVPAGIYYANLLLERLRGKLKLFLKSELDFDMDMESVISDETESDKDDTVQQACNNFLKAEKFDNMFYV